MKNFRALFLLIAAAFTILLTGCGSGSTKDPFAPSRVVLFGDALSDMTTNAQYTVNGSGAVDNWAQQVAASYGIATGNIIKRAAGNALVSAVATQVTTFGGGYQASDLTIVSAGFRDLINLGQGSQSTATATTLGNDYANVVRSMVSNGAKHVAVSNVYDFSVSYAANGGTASAAVMKSLIRAFNDALKANLGSTTATNIGDNVRLIDSEYYMNQLIGNPTGYSFINATSVVCAVTDAGAGIGIGAGKINASLCTTANVGGAFTATYNSYIYADPIYITPAAHRSLGSYAYGLLVARW
jgi:phospholipase/lecithinase/hemolysin